jgi:hypothetical protein
MCQIKAPIAGNSKAIAKIGNAELAHFTKQMLIHELIRGSLVCNSWHLIQQTVSGLITADRLPSPAAAIQETRLAPS